MLALCLERRRFDSHSFHQGVREFISGDRITILGVVRIPHKAVGPVAVPTDW